ncbi:MAG: hypothetical protein OHK0029_20920 [Armatimonadaceae bacterium]
MANPETHPVERDTDERRGISRRAVLLGLLLVPVNVWWLTLTEVRYNILDSSSLPLFITPIFLLLVLVAGNALWRRLAPRYAFQQEELLTAYLMAVVSTAIAGRDMLQNFFAFITYPVYAAMTREKGWQDLFVRDLPPPLFITDKAALNAWYQGNALFPQSLEFLPHWIVPLALWGVFFLVLVFLFGCISTIFRKRWTESERLAFPIIQLPLAMTEARSGFWTNPRMWVGFGIAFTIGLLNGFHELYPSVPNAPWIKVSDLGPFFTIAPWDAIGRWGMQATLYPFAIGLAYFIPLELGFSCWFSYLLIRGYYVFGRVTGLEGGAAMQGWPYMSDICLGAWLGLAGAILWSSRRYLTATFDAAFDRSERGKQLREEDPVEARRWRAAYLGLLGGMVFLLVWSSLIGVAPLVAIGFFLVLFAISLTITRIRAEFGVPHEMAYGRPVDVLVNFFGTNTLGRDNLIGMQTMYWFTRSHRNHPMPVFLEAFKMAEGREMPLRRLIGALALAGIVAVAATFAANYLLIYEAGAGSKAEGYNTDIGRRGFTALSRYLADGQRVGDMPLWFFFGGLVVVGLLAFLQSTFVWWPLHPAGLALATASAMNYFWLPVLVAWSAKLLIIRYGGMNAHKTAIAFFLGLVLGDYTIGALWSLLGLLLGQPTYRIFV